MQVDCKKNKGMGSEYWELYCVEVSLAKKRNGEFSDLPKPHVRS